MNKRINIVKKQKLDQNPNWQEADKLAIIQSTEQLNLEPPKTNPSNGREKDLNPGLQVH